MVDAGLKKIQVEEICRVGSFTRSARVQKRIGDFCKRKEPKRGIKPDMGVGKPAGPGEVGHRDQGRGDDASHQPQHGDLEEEVADLLHVSGQPLRAEFPGIRG